MVRQIRLFLRNKQGGSLLYVIVFSAALLILCGAITSAAIYNLKLTERSTDARQTYLTVKSAVEYAKQTAYRSAQNNTLTNFYVAPGTGGDPFTIVQGEQEPNGTTVYASCKTEGETVSILGKVRYHASSRYRKLGYSFQISSTEQDTTQFLAIGGLYGNNKFMNQKDKFAPGGVSAYPVVLKNKISPSGSSNSLRTPSIFFMGDTGGTTTLQFETPDTTVNLFSNFTYIQGNVTGKFIDETGRRKRSRFLISSKDGGPAFVWLDHVTVQLKNNLGGQSEEVFYDGLYRMERETDLFGGSLEACPQDDADFKELNVTSLLSYVKKNRADLLSGEEEGWAREGKLQIRPSEKSGKSLYLYVSDLSDFQNSNNGLYKASKIILQTRLYSPFVIGKNKKATFQADLICLTQQKNDGLPEDGVADDIFQLKAEDSKSEFILKSASQKTVTLVLPHGLAVQNPDGSIRYTVGSAYDAADAAQTGGGSSQYTYTVPSGINLLSAKETDFKKGAGSGGSSDGPLVISGGVYADSW